MFILFWPIDAPLECYVEDGPADGTHPGSCPDGKVCTASGACDDAPGTYNCIRGYLRPMLRIVIPLRVINVL